MIKKLIEDLLRRLFPFKGVGDIEISHEQMERRSIESTERFWGGSAPVVIAWTGNKPEHVFSDNLRRRLRDGKDLPHPVRVIG